MGYFGSLLAANLYNRIMPKGKTALLGFVEEGIFSKQCVNVHSPIYDLYDLQLRNWEINSKWDLGQKYDTIICLGTAFFAKDPKDFIKRCYEHLNEGGKLYVDFALGENLRFQNFKIGWVKDWEHEYAYNEYNLAWSTVWDDSFLDNKYFKFFQKCAHDFGYNDIKQAIFKEVPKILDLKFVKKYFTVQVEFYGASITWANEAKKRPILYILLTGTKK